MIPQNFGICPICGKRRSIGDHKRCSRILKRNLDEQEKPRPTVAYKRFKNSRQG